MADAVIKASTEYYNVTLSQPIQALSGARAMEERGGMIPLGVYWPRANASWGVSGFWGKTEASHSQGCPHVSAGAPC